MLISFAAILLGSVKLPYQEIKRCILQVDFENLSQHILEQLLNYLPPQDAINQLGTMKDSYDQLAESEQFMVVVSCFHFVSFVLFYQCISCIFIKPLLLFVSFLFAVIIYLFISLFSVALFFQLISLLLLFETNTKCSIFPFYIGF